MEDWYDQHAAALFQFASQLLGSDKAADVITDVFVTIAREPVFEIPPSQSLRTALLNLVQERAGSPEAGRRDQANDIDIPDRTPFLEGPDHHAVIAATTSLPWDIRVALLTTRWSDQSFHEVARALDVDSTVLATRITAGLRQLSVVLRQDHRAERHY